MLCASFSQDHVAISHAGGPTQVLTRLNGKEEYRYDPPAGHHILDLSFVADEPVLMGVQWCYERGGPMTLICVPVAGGKAEEMCELGEVCEQAFCRRGTQLVTSRGDLIDCRTGQTIMRLPFPSED